jgi:hypothetical protein
MYTNSNNSEKVEKYARLFNKKEEAQDGFDFHHAQMQDMKKKIEDLWQQDQRHQQAANNCRNHITAIDKTLNEEINSVKEAIREDQFKLKADDEKRKVKQLAEVAPSGNPLDEPKAPNSNSDPRTLNPHESRIWKLQTCYQCRQLGHGRLHHGTNTKAKYGLPTKPWSSWKSEHPTHNHYILLLTHKD